MLILFFISVWYSCFVCKCNKFKIWIFFLGRRDILVRSILIKYVIRYLSLNLIESEYLLFKNCFRILFINELIYKIIFFFFRCNYIVLYGLKDDSFKFLIWILRLSFEWFKGIIWKWDICRRVFMMLKNFVLLDWIDEKW